MGRSARYWLQYDTCCADNKNIWMTNAGHVYTDGFYCNRILYNEKTETSFDVICHIFSSKLKRPLFECTVKNGNILLETFIAKNPTTIMKKVFTYTDIKTRRKWNGNCSFGLHRSDVKSQQKNIDNNAKLSETNHDSDTNISPTITHISPWIGVVSLGIPNNNTSFQVKIANTLLRLQPGCEAVRNVNENFAELHCKIDDINGKPIFTCFTLEDLVIECSSENITKVVKEAHVCRNVEARRRRSGYDFFGLTRSDVLEQIHCVSNTVEDETDCKTWHMQSIVSQMM